MQGQEGAGVAENDSGGDGANDQRRLPGGGEAELPQAGLRHHGTRPAALWSLRTVDEALEGVASALRRGL